MLYDEFGKYLEAHFLRKEYHPKVMKTEIVQLDNPMIHDVRGVEY